MQGAAADAAAGAAAGAARDEGAAAVAEAEASAAVVVTETGGVKGEEVGAGSAGEAAAAGPAADIKPGTADLSMESAEVLTLICRVILQCVWCTCGLLCSMRLLQSNSYEAHLVCACVHKHDTELTGCIAGLVRGCTLRMQGEELQTCQQQLSVCYACRTSDR